MDPAAEQPVVLEPDPDVERGLKASVKVRFRRVERWVLLPPPPPTPAKEAVVPSPVRNELATRNTAKYPSSRTPLSRSMSNTRSIRFAGSKSAQKTATAEASTVLY